MVFVSALRVRWESQSGGLGGEGGGKRIGFSEAKILRQNKKTLYLVFYRLDETMYGVLP